MVSGERLEGSKGGRKGGFIMLQKERGEEGEEGRAYVVEKGLHGTKIDYSLIKQGRKIDFSAIKQGRKIVSLQFLLCLLLLDCPLLLCLFLCCHLLLCCLLLLYCLLHRAHRAQADRPLPP